MQEYHKINGLYKRHTDGPLKGQFKDGRDGDRPQFSKPEFEILYESQWIGTEKIDGTNIRIHYTPSSVTFAGRTDKAQIPTFLESFLVELCEQSTPFAEVFGETEVTLFGEGYGARIQKSGGNYIPDGVGFILFDVRIGSFWLRREDVQEIADQLGIPAVPTVFEGTLQDAEELVSEGFVSVVAQAEDTPAEGLVLTPVGDFLERNGKRIVTKLKTKDYR